jgi:hypothetical protein
MHVYVTWCLEGRREHFVEIRMRRKSLQHGIHGRGKSGEGGAHRCRILS